MQWFQEKDVASLALSLQTFLAGAYIGLRLIWTDIVVMNNSLSWGDILQRGIVVRGRPESEA